MKYVPVLFCSRSLCISRVNQIETLQRKAAEATEAAAAKRYKSVCVSVGTSELLSIASISLAQKASGSSNSSQPYAGQFLYCFHR